MFDAGQFSYHCKTITIEQRTDNISALETYDVAHAINGRQRKSSESGTKPQGVYPYNAASVISVKDFLNKVKETHKSILSNDVLNIFEESKPENGLYSGQSMFSLGDKRNTLSDQNSTSDND